jgi:hypothetical protein
MKKFANLTAIVATAAIVTGAMDASAARQVALCANFSASPIPLNLECGVEGYGTTTNLWSGGGPGTLWSYRTDLTLSQGFQVGAGMTLLQNNGNRVTQNGLAVACPEAGDINPARGSITSRQTCTVGQLVRGIRVSLVRTT